MWHIVYDILSHLTRFHELIRVLGAKDDVLEPLHLA